MEYPGAMGGIRCLEWLIRNRITEPLDRGLTHLLCDYSIKAFDKKATNSFPKSIYFEQRNMCAVAPIMYFHEPAAALQLFLSFCSPPTSMPRCRRRLRLGRVLAPSLLSPDSLFLVGRRRRRLLGRSFPSPAGGHSKIRWGQFERFWHACSNP